MFKRITFNLDGMKRGKSREENWTELPPQEFYQKLAMRMRDEMVHASDRPAKTGLYLLAQLVTTV